MKRLKKVSSDIDQVKKLLQRVDKASDDLKDIYYSLFDNLNALYQAYPNLYKQIQMVVKLPTNNDAKDIVKFNSDLHEILQHFQDSQYLQSYIDPKKDPNDPQDANNLIPSEQDNDTDESDNQSNTELQNE